MTAQDMNALFEEHKDLITGTIKRNRRLLVALRLEDDDMAQELAIAMLAAIRGFDPVRSESLAAHITCRLQYAILNMKRNHRPHGLTGVPGGERINFLYLNATRPNGGVCELPWVDDTSEVEVSELSNSLSTVEAEVISLREQGFQLKRKAHKEALAMARNKYSTLYDNHTTEGSIAA